ncbi:uncharacterized protein LOC113334636 [Papaver somniferum]|uniref:uncharacterized protein LOC113334636 n=1 Tax=Papaver somniferum TaxID=3469 RepID=UPI000E703B11|nr:uncharacterized protein LOC113334636 [Papaver somniferum]
MRKTDDDADTAFLRAFPFSLADQEKSWLYCLPYGSITTWNGMNKLFLEKYFPASKDASIRKDISGIVQFNGESLYEYYDRYNRLLASCPNHQIPPQLIITHFYEGLLPHERHLIDAASSGALANKTIEEATSLIESMDANTQQFYTRYSSTVRRVSDMGDFSHMEQQMSNMEKMVQCIISEVVPSYEEDAEVNVVFPNHMTSYANKQAAAPNPYMRQNGLQQQFQQSQKPQNQGPNLEDLLKTYIQKQDMAMKNIETKMSQLATFVGKLEAQAAGKLPSQPYVNPREHVNAVTLRSGKLTEEPKQQKNGNSDI